MPIKGGRRTPAERVLAQTMAATNDRAHAGAKSGLSQSGVSRALARPEVQEDIRRLQLAKLHNELLPAAINVLATILGDAKATERGKISAAKIVLDRAFGDKDAGEAKEPHQMTSEEIQARLAQLRSEAADRARVIIEHDPAEAHDVRPVGAFE